MIDNSELNYEQQLIELEKEIQKEQEKRRKEYLDLCQEKQKEMIKELLKAAGANDLSEMNWDTDISPIETLLVQQLLSRRIVNEH